MKILAAGGIKPLMRARFAKKKQNKKQSNVTRGKIWRKELEEL